MHRSFLLVRSPRIGGKVGLGFPPFLVDAGVVFMVERGLCALLVGKRCFVGGVFLAFAVLLCSVAWCVCEGVVRSLKGLCGYQYRPVYWTCRRGKLIFNFFFLPSS